MIVRRSTAFFETSHGSCLHRSQKLESLRSFPPSLWHVCPGTCPWRVQSGTNAQDGLFQHLIPAPTRHVAITAIGILDAFRVASCGRDINSGVKPNCPGNFLPDKNLAHCTILAWTGAFVKPTKHPDSANSLPLDSELQPALPLPLRSSSGRPVP